MAKEELPYTIKFEDRGYLYAFVSGEKDSLEISRSFWTEIAAECQAQHQRKLLVEEDFKTQVSLSDLFLLMSELSQLAFPGLKVAFVDRQFNQHSENQFGIDMARKLGVDCGVFFSVSDAEKWLLSP